MYKLRSKILLLVLVPLAVTSLFLTGWGLHSLRKQVEREFQLRRLALVRTFLGIANQNLEAGNKKLLDDYIHSLLSDPDVDQAALFDPQGKPVAVKRRLSGPASSALSIDVELFQKAIGSFAPQSDMRREGGHRYETVYQRAWAESPHGIRTVGVCYLKLDRYRSDRQVVAAGVIFGGIVLAFMFGVFFLGSLFAYKLVRPVEALRAAAENIRRGATSFPLAIDATDEIGDLARSFQSMVQEVQSKRQNLENMVRDLKETTVSRDYVGNIIKSMVDSLIVVEPSGKIKTVNKAALDLLGYNEPELIGHPVQMLLGEGENIFTAIALKKLLRQGVLKDFESSFKTKAGEKIQILLSGAILRNKEGESEGIVVLAKDIRERKKLEMMLVQSEKLSAVGQLAAGVAHEINNPLGVILGFAQSVAKKIAASDALALPIKSIEREAMRCKNLVQNLLTFSRQSKHNMEDCDLNQTVMDTLGIIEAQARIKSVEVHRELGSIDAIWADKNQLQQIIINLCNNAIDAMPNGGRITVRTRKSEQTGDRRLILEVEDTGSGIPEEIRDRIFNPFFTTKEVGKGTGLGLSLVFEIIQRHKGTIEMKSQVGRGSVFSIFLPMKDS